MRTIQYLQKLVTLTDTPRQDIPKLSVMAAAYPYGFGILCDYKDLLGDYPETLMERGLIVLSSARGRTYFYSIKLMDFFIEEIYSKLNNDSATETNKAIYQLVSSYASLGMDAVFVKKIHDHFSRKIPSGQLVLLAEGIKGLSDPEKEVTLLKGVEFLSKSGDQVMIADNYLNKLQAEYPTLNVRDTILKALQVNNAAPQSKRKTVAGLNTYLRNFLRRTYPTQSQINNTYSSDLIDKQEAESIQLVFNEWKKITNSPAIYPDANQMHKISAPIKNGYTAEQLKQVIRSASQDRWFSSSEGRMTLSFLMSADRIHQLLNSEPSTTQSPQNATHSGGVIVDAMSDQVASIFNAWTNLSGSPAVFPDQGQREMIVQALQMGYSANQICQSFQSASISEWHTGTGRYSGQGSKLSLSILLKADVLQRNLHDAGMYDQSISQEMATQGLMQVALNTSSH